MYRSAVIAIWQCPSRSLITIFMGTPALSANDAAVCRRSWKRIFGTLAAARSTANWRLTWSGCRADPSGWTNTRPLSTQAVSHSNRSMLVVTRQARNTSTVAASSGTTRVDGKAASSG